MGDPATVGIIMASAAAAQAGTAIYGATQAGDGAAGYQLPPELEAKQLEDFQKTLDSLDANVRQAKELVPYLSDRVRALDDMSKGIAPSKDSIQRINQIDQEIATRFGTEIQKDIQSGLITDEAKRQASDLQKSIVDEMKASGQMVDAQTANDIMQRVRDNLANTGKETADYESVRTQLMSQLKEEGAAIPTTDPTVERQLREQETQLRGKLAKQFGPDYENNPMARRQMQDFLNGATDTRYQVAKQLRTEAATLGAAKIQRVRDIGAGISEAYGAGRKSLAESAAVATAAQGVAAGRIARQRSIADLISAPVQTAILAQQPEMNRLAMNVQSAGVALQAGEAQRSAYNQAIQTGALTAGLQMLPLTVGQMASQAQASKMGLYRDLSTQAFSEETKEAMRKGSVSGIKARSDVYGGAMGLPENMRTAKDLSKKFGADYARNWLAKKAKEAPQYQQEAYKTYY